MTTRRTLLPAVLTAFLLLAVVLVAPASAGGAADTARWPGHQPGKVILGMSCGAHCTVKERELGRDYGVHRQFAQWGDWSAVVRKIRSDHADGRLPWVSVKGPDRGSPAGWRSVVDHQQDPAIRELAKALKANDDKPVILTFQHEPSNDGTEAEGKVWAHANNQFHSVLKESGALRNVAFAPVVGDWLFNPKNRAQDPASWVRPGVLRRASFLGIDLYENDSGETFVQRLPRIAAWLKTQGFPRKMLGIGETAATDARYAAQTAVGFIDESLRWALKHPRRVGVVSYFNSTANSRSAVYWPLDESPAKLDAFRRWLGDPRAVS